MLKLDLGCGTAKTKNSIGVDKFLLPGVDVVAQLDEYPYPFVNDVFDEIYMNDIIEHLPDTIRTMEEIYRISKPNAKIYIRTINWNSHYNAMDPTHVKTFHERTFDFFGHYQGREYYSKARFDISSVKYGYNDRAKLIFRSEKLMKYLSHFLNNVLESLYFELKVVKNAEKIKSKKEYQLIDLLRCPTCLKKGKEGKLEKRRKYLTCSHNHKYKLEGEAILMESKR